MTGRRATILLMLAAMAAARPTGDPEDHDGGHNKTSSSALETHTLPATDPIGGDIASTTAEDPESTTLASPPSPPLEDTCYETYTEEHIYTA